MDRNVLREALRLSEAHEPFVLATVADHQGSVPAKKGATLLMRADETLVGTVGGADLEEKVKFLARQALRNHESGLHRFELRSWAPGGLESLCGGTVEVSIQFVSPRPNVLLWGGGHVAEALARQFVLLDFDHSVADDREAFVSAERFPNARHRWKATPEELPGRIEQSGEHFSHVYLLGYSAKKDQAVAALLLPSFPGKVGLIASRTKRELTRRGLRARGLSEAVVGRLRSPIGLPIGAESPQEIAVSIAAEVIQDLHPSRGVEGGEPVKAEEVAKGRGEAGTGQA